ncbi:MAG: bifunctional folylpolyglutamate synthase/dihydrofolate synthase [Paludibacteraceae bacterium]|nr:bifunctional folylpolyglutamate synthase/dihydrofolate synthase [Paludibacteraceae bacterium]
MNYKETLQYLYAQTPMFQQKGTSAYKEGLDNTFFLDEYFNHPHQNYKTIHVGGTNGKGSTSHLLASVLQCAGYKVGLYTSPHLKDFRERIRVNGEMIPEQRVVDFVSQHKQMIEQRCLSFFELTTALAFLYFAEKEVDVAIVEVGLGGRLDCTNVIRPELSIITNVSFDHVSILGDTLEKIATEKSGIIKKNIPVLIGECKDENIKNIFIEKAKENDAPICFAQNYEYLEIPCELKGIYQEKNKHTLMVAFTLLLQLGFNLADSDLRNGFQQVIERTGLQGRWQEISSQPRIVCDTGHNEAGISEVVKQLGEEKYEKLRIVFGMVNDKDISSVLSILPKNAIYYFTKAQIPRALSEVEIQQKAKKYNLNGESFSSVKQALDKAKEDASSNDLIFVGGSNFVIAEIILKKNDKKVAQ